MSLEEVIRRENAHRPEFLDRRLPKVAEPLMLGHQSPLETHRAGIEIQRGFPKYPPST